MHPTFGFFTDMTRFGHVVGAAVAVWLILPQAVAGGQPAPSAQLSALLDDASLHVRSTSFDTQIAANGQLRRIPDVSRDAWIADAALWRLIGERGARISVDSLSTEERLTLDVLRWEAAALK